MTKALFVYPNFTGHESVQQGLLNLSAHAKKAGHHTALIDFTFGDAKSLLLEKAVSYDPDIICFTSNSGMFKNAVEFAAEMKSVLNKPIIFGGPHATVAPEKAIREKPIDMVCIGEGDESFVELLNKMSTGEDFHTISGIWFKLPSGEVVRNQTRALPGNVDQFPFPDYDLFEMNRYLRSTNGAIDIITGRGCPYLCTYCINHTYQEIHGARGKQYIRRYSVDYVMRLIDHLTSKYEIKYINFEDDLFVLDKKWLREFSVAYKSKYPHIGFTCNSRVECADEETFEILKAAGCANVHMGIEAGDVHVRRNIMRRNMSDEQIIRAYAAAKKAGLSTCSYNILGVPGETLEQMEKTIEINRRIAPDHIGVSIFCPYPGTYLYELSVKQNLIDPDFTIPLHHRSHVVLKVSPEMKKTIKHLKRVFRYRVYKNTNMKKAIVILLFDYSYDYFAAIRSRIPSRVKKMLYFVYYKLIGNT